jgi:hypothetical protein
MWNPTLLGEGGKMLASNNSTTLVVNHALTMFKMSQIHL